MQMRHHQAATELIAFSTGNVRSQMADRHALTRLQPSDICSAKKPRNSCRKANRWFRGSMLPISRERTVSGYWRFTV